MEHPSGLRSHHRHRAGDGLSRVLHRARRNETASWLQRKRLRRARRLERSAGQAARARVRCRSTRESLDDSALVGRPVELHGQRQRVSGVGSCHRLHPGGARAAPRGDSERTLRRGGVEAAAHEALPRAFVMVAADVAGERIRRRGIVLLRRAGQRRHIPASDCPRARQRRRQQRLAHEASL